jgi:hypothetical protein
VESILRALREIQETLDAGGHHDAAFRIESLRNLGASSLEAERQSFVRELTGNKYYWGGMGTIADRIMPTPELTVRFISAYLELTRSCEANGMASSYSKDLESTFTKFLEYWRKRLAESKGPG